MPGGDLRRRWADEEHLPFPVIALPLEMTREGAPLYRNKLLWLGFAIPVLLHSLNSLQSIFPTLPSLPINSTMTLSGTGTAVSVDRRRLAVLSASPCRRRLRLSGQYRRLVFSLVLLSCQESGQRLGRHSGLARAGGRLDRGRQRPVSLHRQSSVGGVAGPGTGRALDRAGIFQRVFQRALQGDTQGLDAGEPMSARFAVLGFWRFSGPVRFCLVLGRFLVAAGCVFRTVSAADGDAVAHPGGNCGAVHGADVGQSAEHSDRRVRNQQSIAGRPRPHGDIVLVQSRLPCGGDAAPTGKLRRPPADRRSPAASGRRSACWRRRSRWWRR